VSFFGFKVNRSFPSYKLKNIDIRNTYFFKYFQQKKTYISFQICEENSMNSITVPQTFLLSLGMRENRIPLDHNLEFQQKLKEYALPVM
jgi:hypothetical protein